VTPRAQISINDFVVHRQFHSEDHLLRRPQGHPPKWSGDCQGEGHPRAGGSDGLVRAKRHLDASGSDRGPPVSGGIV